MYQENGNSLKQSQRSSFKSMSLSLPSSSSSHKLSKFMCVSSILFILILCSSEVHSINNIGCLIDGNLCEDYEYCVDDNLLGFCVSEEDKNEFTREVTRSESAIDTDIDAPIRIHKYNIDESQLASYEDNENDDSAKKARITEALKSVLEERKKKLSDDYEANALAEADLDDDSNEIQTAESAEEQAQNAINPAVLEELLSLQPEPTNDVSIDPYVVYEDYEDSDSDSDRKELDSDLARPEDFEDYADYAYAKLTKRSLADYQYDEDYLLNNDEGDLPPSEDDGINSLLEQIINKNSDYYLNDNADDYYGNDDDFLIYEKRGLSQDAAADDDESDEIADVSSEEQQQIESKAAAIARIEDTLNNAQNDFLSNLHHISEAEAQQAEDKKTLMDDISQFFHDYDQKARLNQAEEQVEREPRIRAQNLQQEMEKKAVEGDMGAEMSAYDVVDASYIFIELDRSIDKEDVEALLKLFSNITKVPIEYIGDINISSKLLFFKIRKPYLNTSKYVNIIGNSKDLIKERTGLKIISCGLGNKENYVEVSKQKYIDSSSENFLLVTIIICATVACVLLSLLVIFLIRRRAHLRNKLANDVSISGGKINYNDEERLITEECKGSSFSFWPFNKLKKSANLNDPSSPSQNYQDLCRSRMQGKAAPQGTNTSVLNESTPSIVPSSAARVTTSVGSDGKTESSRSSTSSWSEEPITTVNMDITTGHVILAYIEEHLNDKNRLTKEWQDLCDYEADTNKTETASLPQNLTKNRYSNILAYDHSRVKIGDNKDSDYINANYITDDDPKNPAYIATQGPLIHTTCDFWKMIWEQGSIVIVSLCRTVEYGSLKCNQYWPNNGSEVYEKFEVHLVSEHVWSDDFLVRSFFLKNLENGQSRTITQFHYLTWPENGLPSNLKSVLDFRRKVNKSYKSKASPIVVHCNDGVGRTGTYIMIDMVLNKITKGAKEIDLAATVEFLRDQRPGMVKTKPQFEFSFAIITEEVQNMLKAIGQ